MKRGILRMACWIVSCQLWPFVISVWFWLMAQLFRNVTSTGLDSMWQLWARVQVSAGGCGVWSVTPVRAAPRRRAPPPVRRLPCRWTTGLPRILPLKVDFPVSGASLGPKAVDWAAGHEQWYCSRARRVPLRLIWALLIRGTQAPVPWPARQSAPGLHLGLSPHHHLLHPVLYLVYLLYLHCHVLYLHVTNALEGMCHILPP